jgi:hypothetical protein
LSEEEVADAIRQIRHITTAYFDALDRGDMAAIGEVFRYGRTRASIQGGGDDDVAAVIEIDDEPYEGSRRAVQMFQQGTRFFDGIPCTKHFTSNLRIEVDVDGRRATSWSRFTVVQSRPELPLQPVVTGRYVDSFELREGQWWLVDRFEDSFLWGDVRQHLHDAVLDHLHLPSTQVGG